MLVLPQVLVVLALLGAALALAALPFFRRPHDSHRTPFPRLVPHPSSSVRYFDHLVAEAVFLIEQGPRWPPARECEDVSVAELERRATRAQTP